nr:immunoglobulin light chain junction region [Macaca mulatta]MOV67550.1 immunoglobulin light chain junction region [Macaca mulatta]MOV67858.1 immunoglobulin light chain junction region [Macaca mulatta]MOV68087.1 immunoglobulin light chain junction region [Macaca mulatta]MOV68611.1 immunoglobulin light chain junction region [Macaca mulatta]
DYYCQSADGNYRVF